MKVHYKNIVIHYGSNLAKIIRLLRLIVTFGHARLLAITFGKHVFTPVAVNFLPKDAIEHEECHAKQYAKYGFWKFLLKYIWCTTVSGYTNCKYEVEARKYALLTEEQQDNYVVQ